MEAKLTFKRQEFIDALAKLRKLEPRLRLPWVSIGFIGENMTVGYMSEPKKGLVEFGTKVGLPAEGTWPGEAAISRSFLMSFTKIMPQDDTLVFELKNGKLRVGSMAVSCLWRDAGSQKHFLSMRE